MGCETTGIEAEMATIPAVDKIGEAVDDAKGLRHLAAMLLIEVLDVSRRICIGVFVPTTRGCAFETISSDRKWRGNLTERVVST
jgi:hypothetical protein